MWPGLRTVLTAETAGELGAKIADRRRPRPTPAASAHAPVAGHAQGSRARRGGGGRGLRDPVTGRGSD